MIEHDMLRQVLEQQAIAAAAPSAANLTLCFDNSEFVQPQDGSQWSEFWISTGATMPAEITGPRGLEKTSGLLQFTLKAPEAQGNGAIIKAAGILKRAFNRKQFVVPPDGYVTLDPFSIETHGKPMNGFFNVVGWSTFWFHHRDPEADARWTRS